MSQSRMNRKQRRADAKAGARADPAGAALAAAVQHHQGGRLEEAAALYRQILAADPRHADANHLLGLIAFQRGRNEVAVDLIGRAIASNPSFPAFHSNLGNALNAMGRLNAALSAYDAALRLNPDFAEAHNNRGSALYGMGRLNEALSACDAALRLRPDYADAHYNRGNALHGMGRLDEALSAYDTALRLRPDFAEAIYNRAHLRLRLRDFPEGFEAYRSRWDIKDVPSKPQKTTLPSVSKAGLRGRLLIWAEQGLGDEIFYAGLLPALLTHDVSVTVSADQRLHPIYKRAFPGVGLLDRKVLGHSSIDSGFDAQAPIGDLGCLLDLDAAAIQATRSPYLLSDPVRREGYRRTLSASGSGLVCGVAWKSVNPKFGGAKSIGLEAFEPLLSLAGITFVNLQYGDVDDQIGHVRSSLAVDIQQVPGLDVFHDIDGLLALIDACDVIVTTSNVTAHLAGSIGKRAAVLVPHGKGRIWYWHENDTYSLWYPQLRLFYQDNPLTWDQTIKDCADWVKSLL
jgi:Flp pilus assembly protein TadD